MKPIELNSHKTTPKTPPQIFDVSKCRHEMEKLKLIKRRSGLNHVVCKCGKKYG